MTIIATQTDSTSVAIPCSAEGISLAAQYAELVAYSITVAYNLDHGMHAKCMRHAEAFQGVDDSKCPRWHAGYAFSTYGDTAACWVQDIILIVLIAKYR